MQALKTTGIMAEIMRRIQERKQQSAIMSNSRTCSPTDDKRYDCPKCRDIGFLVDGVGVGGLVQPCSCLELKRYQTRLKGAMIPAEFQESTFETFKILQPIHQKMLDVANRYLADFDDLIKNETANGLGFIAEFGESRLKAIQDPQERAKMKTKYNSYGLGKTHLTVAIGKKLLERGIPVLFISDAVVMDELTLLKTSDKDQYMKKWSSLIEVPVLIWDDLGKSNYSEAKKSMYYQIINERYKRRGIIIYSSNEDTTTLEMRLGDASMSRLYAMSKGRIIRCSGIDMRLVGGIAQ